MYYQVVEGEQLFISLCAVLYQGCLGRNLTVLLSSLNNALGESGMWMALIGLL